MSKSIDIQTVNKLIKKIKVAMLTTADTDGTLHSRPMATQSHEFDGTLWFFTHEHSGKVHEVESARQVNVSYANPSDQEYVSLSGTASVVRERGKIDELWSPLLKAWFPKGKEDPEIALLRIEVEKAEYWDSPSGTVVKLVGFAKALITGQAYEPGKNEKIDFA